MGRRGGLEGVGGVRGLEGELLEVVLVGKEDVVVVVVVVEEGWVDISA